MGLRLIESRTSSSGCTGAPHPLSTLHLYLVRVQRLQLRHACSRMSFAVRSRRWLARFGGRRFEVGRLLPLGLSGESEFRRALETVGPEARTLRRQTPSSGPELGDRGGDGSSPEARAGAANAGASLPLARSRQPATLSDPAEARVPSL